MLIQHRKPRPNPWRIRDEQPLLAASGAQQAAADSDAAVVAPPLPPGVHEIVPLAVWRSVRERLPSNHSATRGRFGVLLEPGDDPRELAADFDRIALVAIRFPLFNDGRGYSTARLLRQQLGWRGTLLAVGDVLRDQLLLMERCGFDAMWLRADQDAEDALSAFGDFSDAYQASAASVPLFLRRDKLAGVKA